MRPTFFVVSFLVLSSLVAQAQENDKEPPEGRITATVLNDEGEPIRKASVCIFIRRPNEGSTQCGSLTDKDGKIQIEKVKIGTVGIYADNVLGGYWEEERKCRGCKR